MESRNAMRRCGSSLWASSIRATAQIADGRSAIKAGRQGGCIAKASLTPTMKSNQMAKAKPKSTTPLPAVRCWSCRPALALRLLCRQSPEGKFAGGDRRRPAALPSSGTSVRRLLFELWRLDAARELAVAQLPEWAAPGPMYLRGDGTWTGDVLLVAADKG